MELVLAVLALCFASSTLVLVVLLVRQNSVLFRAAMSRTPAEFRKFERDVRRPEKTALQQINEDAATILASMSDSDDTPLRPMPHGFGGE